MVLELNFFSDWCFSELCLTLSCIFYVYQRNVLITVTRKRDPPNLHFPVRHSPRQARNSSWHIVGCHQRNIYRSDKKTEQGKNTEAQPKILNYFQIMLIGTNSILKRQTFRRVAVMCIQWHYSTGKHFTITPNEWPCLAETFRDLHGNVH
jgi:hypothetical protein